MSSNVLAITPVDPDDITSKSYVDNKLWGPANGGTGLTGTPASGQIPIGNGSGFTLSTITAGTNVSIVNGPGTITISAGAVDNSIINAIIFG